MDYDAALQKFHKDERPLQTLEQRIGVPWETLRDIKNGTTKSPRLDTLRKMAKHYERKARAA